MADVEAFIERWKTSGASERANYQLFLTQLCEEVLGVDPPRPAQAAVEENTYVFERSVSFADGETTGHIDLYKKDCFVLEAKQGSDRPVVTEKEALTGERLKRKMGTARRGGRGWNQAMQRAKRQARRYARSLPEEDGWPPFLVVVDVGYCIDLYADFARQGKTYVQFPDPQRFRIRLEDLRDPEIRSRLRQVWTDPQKLDPARRSARVTRGLAERLAKLAASLEEGGYSPDRVAGFLMRCLFTMFAEDVELIPRRSFTGLLQRYQGKLEVFPKALEHLWEKMNEGGFAPTLEAEIKQFNGHLFAEAEALPISEAQLDLLIRAAEADWADVEPAIFGTLLERALDPRERHKLGAHYTPRAYVERLVNPTVIEPLREEWEAAQTAAAAREADEDEAGALEELKAFHRRLCEVRVLDPACGSGNFLYVTLDHLKRLEAEVLQTLQGYEGHQPMLDMTGGHRVSPEQLLGLEINPRAAAITEVVLWIGYLQWHFRTYGSADRLDPPILKDYDNIQHRDAVLVYDEKTERTDGEEEVITRWDQRTYKEHPTTGEMVPDESAQVPVYDYTNPEPAEWPQADFVVGNPPFVGNKRMREALGDGYTEAVREAYLYKVPKSADFVMYWWYKAAKAVRKGAAERFGFVSTNSIRQTFNRRVIEKQTKASPPISLAFAIPDHPWVASKDGADVRIAMTVGAVSNHTGVLQTVVYEEETSESYWNVELEEQRGNILADLSIGADVTGADPLKANEGLSFRGMTLVGSGFVLDEEEARQLMDEGEETARYIKPYLRGRDIVQSSRGDYVIDLFGLSSEEVRERVPELYQVVADRVKPFREQNNRASYREKWWIFGEPRSTFRRAARSLSRYIATPRTSKHRIFTFLSKETIPESEVVVFASDDAYMLGVLSSRIHITWALAAGGHMGVGNDPRYNNTDAFDPFPFPAASFEQKERIRELAEQLDRHRKDRQEKYSQLTLTDLYNVLKKERIGEALDEDEQEIHEQGLVGVLQELHDDLDAAVAEAYGWGVSLPEEKILQRLVALNKQRRAEEEQGRVRYLRPAYQAPEEVQAEMDIDVDVETTSDGAPAEKTDWPETLAERAQLVRQVVLATERPLTVEDVAAHFRYARRKQVRGLLETLEALGQARQTGEGLYAA